MPRTSPLCNYFVFFKYITNSRCLSTLFSALCCFGAQFTILSFSPPALRGAKRRTMYSPLRVPYSLIGRGTLCARQPITPTTLWGLNSPALQTLFSACPSHQKTAGANRPGCPFLLISKAIPHNSRLTAQAPLRQLRHGICVAKMLDNVGLRYPHRASGAKAPRTLRPLPLLRFAVSATGGAHLCSIQYYLRFWPSSCRTSLAVSTLRIMRYCLKTKQKACAARREYHLPYAAHACFYFAVK